MSTSLSVAEPLVPFGDVVFDNVTMAEAVNGIVSMAERTDKARYVCTANTDHLAIVSRDPDFHALYKRADMVLADGMPVVWLARMHLMGPIKERVAGSDLFWELASAASVKNLRLFLLGGVPGSAERARAALLERFPTLEISGVYCPSFEEFDTPAEQAKIREIVTSAAPHILFVGLGAPKQEKWIVQHKDALHVPVSIGIGGTFEMASGTVRRAPEWMQRNGLEWAYRLSREPGRLWNRYMGRDLPFLVSLVPGIVKMLLLGKIYRSHTVAAEETRQKDR